MCSSSASDHPTILHVRGYGTPEWIPSSFAVGNGAPFAYALLQKYQRVRLTIEQASVLAFKVLEEAIAIGAYGLGLPLQVWHALPSGLQKLDEARLAALEDTAKELREREIQLLVGKHTPQPILIGSSDHPTT